MYKSLYIFSHTCVVYNTFPIGSNNAIDSYNTITDSYPLDKIHPQPWPVVWRHTSVEYSSGPETSLYQGNMDSGRQGDQPATR